MISSIQEKNSNNRSCVLLLVGPVAAIAQKPCHCQNCLKKWPAAPHTRQDPTGWQKPWEGPVVKPFSCYQVVAGASSDELLFLASINLYLGWTAPVLCHQPGLNLLFVLLDSSPAFP